MQRRGKDLRIGDSERERAIALLGDHLTAGRLDIHEYDQRCGRVTAAQFTSELHRVFEDLPGPLPGQRSTSVPEPPSPRAGGVSTVLAIGAVLLLLVVAARQIWLLPILGIAAAIWFGRRGR